MAVQKATYLQSKLFVSVAVTHFFVDVLNNSRNLLIALLAVSLGLSNQQVALVALLYSVGNALAQPAFGWLADHFGPRWLVVGGLGWMILFYGIASLAGEWVALAALTVAGVGSGAFHPTGTKVASESSVTQRSQATALFFSAGQLGLFLGPVFAGILLDQFNRAGFLVLPLIALAALVTDWRWTNGPYLGEADEQPLPARPRPRRRHSRRAALIVPIILASSSASISTLTFAPKLFTELGLSQTYVGWLTGLFMMGSAAGVLLGGSLADRLGGRPVIVAGFAAGILPLFFYLGSERAMQMLLLLLAGFATGMPHSVLVIRAQSLLPGRRALASGLTLGLMFFGGSAGAYLVGLAADLVGLGQALPWLAVLLLAAALLGTLLPAEG